MYVINRIDLSLLLCFHAITFTTNLHKQRQQNLRNIKVQVTINKTKSATSIEYSRYHGMLKDWTRRWDAPLCLCTNSIQSPVSSKGVRRWSFMRRETRVAFCLKLWRERQHVNIKKKFLHFVKQL